MALAWLAVRRQAGSGCRQPITTSARLASLVHASAGKSIKSWSSCRVTKSDLLLAQLIVRAVMLSFGHLRSPASTSALEVMLSLIPSRAVMHAC